MGMSTYVQGFRVLNPEFEKMMEVKNFCDRNKVSLPKEVEQFFGKFSLDPEEYIREKMDQSLEVDIPKDAVDRDSEDSSEWIEVDLEKLPSGVKKIRFTNSY